MPWQRFTDVGKEQSQGQSLGIWNLFNFALSVVVSGRDWDWVVMWECKQWGEGFENCWVFDWIVDWIQFECILPKGFHVGPVYGGCNSYFCFSVTKCLLWIISRGKDNILAHCCRKFSPYISGLLCFEQNIIVAGMYSRDPTSSHSGQKSESRGGGGGEGQSAPKNPSPLTDFF